MHNPYIPIPIHIHISIHTPIHIHIHIHTHTHTYTYRPIRTYSNTKILILIWIYRSLCLNQHFSHSGGLLCFSSCFTLPFFYHLEWPFFNPFLIHPKLFKILFIIYSFFIFFLLSLPLFMPKMVHLCFLKYIFLKPI
jgi:hypothetical protein